MPRRFYVANTIVDQTILLKARDDYAEVELFNVADAEACVRSYLRKDLSGQFVNKLKYAPILPGQVVEVHHDAAKILMTDGKVLYQTAMPLNGFSLVVTTDGVGYSGPLPDIVASQIDRSRFFTENWTQHDFDPTLEADYDSRKIGSTLLSIFGCQPELTPKASNNRTCDDVFTCLETVSFLLCRIVLLGLSKGL